MARVRRTDRPYVSSVRAESAAATRARLLEVARQMLQAGPGAELTIDAVAERAGVARMTVYNQFGSKAGLVEAIADDVAARGGLEHIRDVFAADDPLDALALVVEIFTNLWSAEFDVIRALRAIGRFDEAVGRAMRDAGRRRILQLQLERLDTSADAGTLDVIVALTSFETYEVLRPGRTTEEVSDVIWSAVERLL
jgi:AcrR family transcriptional regulator